MCDNRATLTNDKNETIMKEIKETVYSRQFVKKLEDSSTSKSDDSPQSSQFLSIPCDLILKATYEHGKKHTEIMGVTYNERMRQFIILDSKGITNWKRDAVEPRVHRALSYKKYEYRLITNVIYAKRHNCYFILGKDFSLKVFNRDFTETCSVSSDLRSVLFMLFNPVRDELITGGLGGTKVWHFHQQSVDAFGDLRMQASYGLTLKYELSNVGGSWVRHVELDHQLEHLYCCSDHDLYVYDLEGKLLFKFERAHSMSITGCRYSRNATVLVTSSLDCEVKVWSLIGGLVHTFRGHSRAVTNLILHPNTSNIVVTCSLDGSVRMWSLDTMDCLYSLVVSIDGIQWMGLTDDNLLYLSTPTTLTLWHLNYSVQFWALVRSQVTRIVRCGCKGKTTRLMAISEDSSVRLLARSNHKSLTTVLPPPNISPLQHVLNVCYSREFNTIYMLINSHEIWVYTARTDPACRIAVWHMTDIQKRSSAMQSGITESERRRLAKSVRNPPQLHKTAEVVGHGLVRCCCTTVLTAAVIMWTDEGYCCPLRDSYLLVGLEDGRILFMDPVIKGHKYLEFKTGKDPVLDMRHDVDHSGLVTLHKLKGMMKILVWCIPDLTLQHEVYVPVDLRDFARESNILVSGHESGCVIFHTLEPATDSGHYKAKMVPIYEEFVKLNHRPEHQAPVIAVDVCVALKLICSCSDDGAIKIWHDKVLLTEIMLNSGLSAACFLNNSGDLLVGYLKHMFYIDHTKVCPQLTVPESDVENFDKESYICEDPAVLYEGVAPNHEQVTMENYLVPFDLEFSKDFLEGRVTLSPEAAKEEVSDDDDDESQVSVVPTEIYLSPKCTPRRRLSFVDLILGSEVSNYDLLKHVKKTLDHLAEKEKQDAAQLAYLERMDTEKKAFLQHQWNLMKGGHLTEDVTKRVKGMRKGKRNMKVEKEMDIRFSFPQFGESPGPTPVSSTCTTPEVLTESEEPEKLDKVSDDIGEHVQIMPETKMQVDEVRKLIITEDKEKPDQKAAIESFTPKTKFGLSNVKVDMQALMKDAKKATPVTTTVQKCKADPKPVQVLDSCPEAREKKSGPRNVPVKKKMMASSQRKNFKSKLSGRMGKCEAKDEPPTQIQTLELQEQETNNSKRVSLARKNELSNDQEESGTSIRANRELESSSSSVSELEGATVKAEDISSPEVSVPALPSFPIAVSRQNFSRPPTSKSRSITTVKSASQSNADLSHHSNRQEGINESDGTEVKICSGGESGNSRTLTAVSTVHMVDASVSSTESKDDGSAFRNGLMYKNQPETRDFADKASASPDKQYSGYDSSWMIRDISVSKHQNESFDQGTVQGFIDHRKLRPRADLTKAQVENMLTTSEILTTLSRPLTSVEGRLLGKPELENVVKDFQRRPHTSQIRFTTEDLQAAFDASMVRYKSLLKSSLTSDKFYQNNDKEFSENWHERQIERHMLVRLQKELRAQRQKQMVKHTSQERWKQHVIKDHDTADRRHSSPHLSSNTIQRASTVHGNRSAINIGKLSPMSSRPHTTSRLHDWCSPQLLKQSKPQPFLVKEQQMQQTKNKQTKHHQCMMDPQGKAGLGYQKSFRCKLRQQKESQAVGEQPNSDLSLPTDPWLLDPRNPNAVRPKSSKSIPNKCHHFVLVTTPKSQDNFPLPTSQEKYLLAMRFPQQAERIFRRIEKLLVNTSLEPPESRVGYNSCQDQIF